MAESSVRRVRVFAPATVANVACGFDIMGFALEAPGDEVEAWWGEAAEPGAVTLESIEGDAGVLPRDPQKNSAAVTAAALLRSQKIARRLHIKLTKKMPIGSGLGSSAASSVAGVVAANELLDTPLPAKELTSFAVEGERAACGSPHADNVAPSLLGGFALIRSYAPLDVIPLPAPRELFAVVTYPHIEIKTSDSRSILRQHVAFKDAIQQMGNAAALVTALHREDYALVGRSLEDVLVEPSRSLLIPGFQSVKKAALAAGALGCSISGAGPSVFALCKGDERTAQISKAMSAGFAAIGIESTVYVSRAGSRGARILD